MVAVLQELVQILVGGITDLASGIGTGINSMVTDLFLSGSGTQADPYKLSAAGGVIAVFGGIALAIGLTTLVTKFIMTLGSRK